MEACIYANILRQEITYILADILSLAHTAILRTSWCLGIRSSRKTEVVRTARSLDSPLCVVLVARVDDLVVIVAVLGELTATYLK